MAEKVKSGIITFPELPSVQIHQNIDRRAFAGLLDAASAIIGNSSCGILEAPSFNLPAINIGNRQRGRMQACNVINCGHDRKAICGAVETALHGSDFRAALEHCENPYGDGRSSERIVKILEEVELGRRLLDKVITY